MATIKSRSEFMDVTNVYWTTPQITQTSLFPMSGHLGFHITLPYPDPVSVPSGYSGEGSENVFGKREMVYTNLPEMFTVGGNIMPTTSGIPRVDPNSFAARVNRKTMTVRV